MVTYFPPELWRNIFSFDRTYKEVFDNVSGEFTDIPQCDCGAHIWENNSWMAPSEHIDIVIIELNGIALRILNCRKCGITETHLIPSPTITQTDNNAN